MPESKQIAILRFIQEQQAHFGYAPTIREIAQQVGLASTATVHGHINRLIKKGYLTKKQAKSRALHVTPKGLSLLESTISTQNMIPFFDNNASIDTTDPDNLAYLALPEQIITQHQNLFMVHQQNQTMHDLGIFENDVLIVQRQTSATDGDIILVDLPEHPKQVYRFFHEADHYRLQPENKQLSPVITRSLTILGKIISLYRPQIK